MAYLEDHNIDYFITEDERKKATEYLIKNDLKRYKLIFVQPFSSAIARDMPASKVRAALIKVIQSNPDKQWNSL